MSVGRKKKLPDHERKEEGIPKPLYSPEQVEDIRKEFKFRVDYALGEELDDATFWFLGRRRSMDYPSKPEQRKLLETVSERSTALLEALRKLGPTEKKRIYTYLTDAFTLDELAEELRILGSVTDSAKLDVIAKPADTSIAYFTIRLKDIYEAGTGSKATVTTDPVTNEYSGKFYEFMEWCLALSQIFKSNQALGQDIKRALRLGTKKDSKNL